MFALSLKGEGSRKNRVKGLASPEEIERKAAFGYAHFVYEGDSFFVNIDDEYDKERVIEEIGVHGYKWFHEATGDRNWVLYNPEMYHIDKNWEGNNVLRIRKGLKDGTVLETPLNASSLCSMFSWMTFPNNLQFGRQFKMSKIKDTSLMFAGCTIPADFILNDFFNTSHVESMRYMFYSCVLPENFRFGDFFYTSKVKNMEYMFAESIIPRRLNLGYKFDTLNVNDMNHMFFNTRFKGSFDFGPGFRIPAGANIDSMFEGAMVRDVKREADFPFADARELLISAKVKPLE